MLAEKGFLCELEKRLKQSPKPVMRDIEEAMLAAIRNSNDDCIPLLVVAGARSLDCALCLAIQLERIKAIAILLLCKAAITGDRATIRSLLLSEPLETVSAPWYVPSVHEIFSQKCINMSYPIEVSIFEKKYEATKELLLSMDIDMGLKQVDWSELNLTILDPSWIYSIAPWVVSLKLVRNHLRMLPSEIFNATQLTSLDLSQNILEIVPIDLFSLPNLKYLSLGHNRLNEIPETSNWSASLLSLDLSENLLSTLPQGIRYSNIETLNLSRNQFKVVPKCLCCIRTLTSLDLSQMQISPHLPNGGVLHSHGRVREIFRAQACSDKPCNHIKLVLLCHSDLAKKMMLSRLKPNFNQSQLLPNQALPEIDLFQWKFPPSKQFSTEKLIYFNTWLIGSHYSCRFIYPCFFTSSALYTIVWDFTITADMTKQITPYIDILVQCIPSANIKVIVVLPDQHEGWNSEEKVAEKLKIFFSKPSYKSLSYHGFLMVVANPKVKEGRSDFKQGLYDTAQQMTINGQHIVGRRIPKTYFSLIPVLEKQLELYRSESKLGVLEESTIWMLFDKALAFDPPDKMELPAMVDFLQEAGFLLHYGDPNVRLDQHYFIQPDWLYDMLLQVVHHMLEHSNHLFITYDELCSLVNIKENKILTQALIRLMVRYAIVLPTHRDQYLVTCLLPHSQPPSDVLYCGTLRRQFAPRIRSIPIDPWSRLLCSIISNLTRIIDISMFKKESKENADTNDKIEDTTMSCSQKVNSTTRDAQCFSVSSSLSLQFSPDHFSMTEGSLSSSVKHAHSLPEESDSSRCSQPVTIDEGVQIWDSGMIYNYKGIKFSIFPCVSEICQEGIEICCTQDNYGHVVMAQLCWLIQNIFEERFPDLFSTDTPLQNCELALTATCPICTERNCQNTYPLFIESLIQLLPSKEYKCRHHPEAIPLQDLIPDYLLLDLPPHLHITRSMFELNNAKLSHYRDGQIGIYNGHFNGKEIAIKVYHQTNSSKFSCVRRESDILSSLNHPNIIKMFGFCLDPACVLIEKAPLGNLYQMNTDEKVGKTVLFYISCQVASALSYLHQHSIIYRTLKISSILIWSLDFNSDVSIKLADFERAAYQCTPSGLISKSTFVYHHAPEMVKYSFREEHTEKVDIYSFGILLNELMTRWQPYCEITNSTHSKESKLSVNATSYRPMIKLMKECRQEEPMARPSAIDLLLQISQPSFQCLIASQVLRDFNSVKGCCFVPSVQQIWVYGEYKMTIPHSEGVMISDGMQIFILNEENLVVQRSLELRDRATFIFMVNNQVWIGMTEMCIHVYNATTFRFTHCFHLDDSATTVTDNDCYVFVGQINGYIKCYSKVQLQRGDCQPIDIKIGDKAIEAMVTTGDTVWVGCGNELVILHAEDEIKIVQRAMACEPPDHVSLLTVSYNTATAWYITSNSLCITSWDIHTTEQKYITDLSEYLSGIWCELNYVSDPSFLRVVSIECVGDTLWAGLSCGMIIILSDTEQPEIVAHFKAHRHAVEFLQKIPHSNKLHQEHDYSLILSGGFGEVSSLSSMASEQNGVVMLWHAFTAHEFNTISKRHTNYHSTSVN